MEESVARSASVEPISYAPGPGTPSVVVGSARWAVVVPKAGFVLLPFDSVTLESYDSEPIFSESYAPGPIAFSVCGGSTEKRRLSSLNLATLVAPALIELRFGSYVPAPGVSLLRTWPPSGTLERKAEATRVLCEPHSYKWP